MEMKAQYTPGPWEAYGRTVYAQDNPIALAHSSWDYERGIMYGEEKDIITDDQAFINARLIAACPKLISSVKMALGFLEIFNDGELLAAGKEVRSYAKTLKENLVATIAEVEGRE